MVGAGARAGCHTHRDVNRLAAIIGALGCAALVLEILRPGVWTRLAARLRLRMRDGED